MKLSVRLSTLFIAAGLLAASFSGVDAEAKKEFNIAWSIYVGWMPWPYAVDAGIVKKWGDKYGITINVTQINDYVESINQYTAGKFDGVTLTNMDALTIPAAGGVDTTGLIVGDFSNGNDGIVSKTAKAVQDLKGKTVAVKDNICVAGVPMMNGSMTMEGYTPLRDATVVTRSYPISESSSSSAWKSCVSFV